MRRRTFLKAAGIGGVAAGGGTLASLLLSPRRQPQAQVAIYRAASYREPFSKLIREGLLQYPDTIRRARAGTVVLKPNIVEYRDGFRVNTHPAVIAGAIAAFQSLGARQVVVAEGPGHCRDTELLVTRSGIADAVSSEKSDFVDLNLDPAHAVSPASNHTRLGEIAFPETILSASLVVSLPKMKTHHWQGVTLSLKNMFGTVPGAVYGWPKNILHWSGIANSIVDINVALKPGFAIVDGVEGMEGDGPLRGDTVHAGVIVMGDNLTAVDATAARVMGFYPERVEHLALMLKHGGTLHESRIAQRGETIASVRQNFRVLDQFALLKQAPGLRDFLRQPPSL
jgi:uncharacterized protein (DUF362 family)